ncbi:MAG: putative transcriptional regulator [Candidatus Nanohaloarchaea archaeon]|jgi:putative transcriptional regulator
MQVKNQLKKLRQEKDLTQAELAKEMDVSRQTVNAIETGKYNPSLELALELAGFFDTEVEKIFRLEE